MSDSEIRAGIRELLQEGRPLKRPEFERGPGQSAYVEVHGHKGGKRRRTGTCMATNGKNDALSVTIKIRERGGYWQPLTISVEQDATAIRLFLAGRCVYLSLKEEIR